MEAAHKTCFNSSIIFCGYSLYCYFENVVCIKWFNANEIVYYNSATFSVLVNQNSWCGRQEILMFLMTHPVAMDIPRPPHSLEGVEQFSCWCLFLLTKLGIIQISTSFLLFVVPPFPSPSFLSSLLASLSLSPSFLPNFLPPSFCFIFTIEKS